MIRGAVRTRRSRSRSRSRRWGILDCSGEICVGIRWLDLLRQNENKIRFSQKRYANRARAVSDIVD